MRKTVLMAATIALGGMAMPPGEARAHEDDELVCYKLSRFTNERFKLDVKRHSPLSEKEEERKFGHPRQVAFAVHGKEVGGCGEGTMLATTGTVIVAEPRENNDNANGASQAGAHLGLEVHASRPNSDDFPDFCRSIEWDCTTSEISPTPDTWDCFARNEFDRFLGAITLTKVDEKEDPLCSVFEDGANFARTAAAPGSASGLRESQADR